MEPSQNNREIGWSDSSDSEAWIDDEEMGVHNVHENNSIRRRGPVIQLDRESLEHNRVFWRQCIVGFLLDRRCFSVRRMQSILAAAWRLRGGIRIVGRQGNFYIIHCEYPSDQEYILQEGPWSVDGTLLVVERWTPNLTLSQTHLTSATLWVQIHNLPLEYHDIELAHFIGNLLGEFVSIDWQPTFPRNIRFLRIRVKLDPWLPLIAGFILKRDDGQYTWVECRYERVFKICKRCGIIGHARSQCHMDMFDIEELLRDQAYRIRVQYPVEFALDLMEVMYNDDIRAFRRHPSRRTTRVRFDKFVVTNLDDLEVNQQEAGNINPNSPTNDSLWRNNLFMDSDNDLDPPNTPITPSHLYPTFDQNTMHSECWIPPEDHTLRFVEVDEGYRGWTNADIISMDWEPDAQSHMDCDDHQNFSIELFLVDNPEAYEDSSEPRWHGHSHFHVGESSGTANDPNETQITTGTLTTLEQAGPQENNWNQELPHWQITQTRIQHFESEVSKSTDNPVLMGIELMVYLSKSQSPGYILNLVQLFSQNTIQSMGLFLQQLVPQWLYDLHAIPQNQRANPITNPLHENPASFAIGDITPSRNILMDELVPLATPADVESSPASPKRQRDEDDGETSRVNRRRLNQEQGNLSNRNHNFTEEADPIITSLHNIESENNEFILRLRITGQSDQFQETEVIWSKQSAETEHQQNIVANLIQLLANIRLSEAAQQRPPQQP
uniref:CCHC-type domain-containing protein n=1 Tax=Quercus lobata TaxID=97700 RepID=A0A7N2R8K9_QUELO